MDYLIFAVGATLPDASQEWEGASYAGPAHLLSRRKNEIVVEVGDPDAAFARLTYEIGADVVTLESDISGQASLRYVVRDDRIYVASHDILLAPYLPFEIDEQSCAELQRVGWSTGGYSLIKGIEVCRGGERVHVSPSGAERNPVQFPTGSASDQVDLCLNFFGARLPSGQVTVELSAGFDSRAALAATLACKPASDVRAFSEGPIDSQDVVVAQKICELHGIAFTHRQTPDNPVDAILDNWSRMSVNNNGHIEVNILASQGDNENTVCGDGGEIFRGFFYPYLPFQRLVGGVRGTALEAISKKLGGSDRLTASVDRLAGETEAETMDRFYLAERFGVWNQKLFRSGGHRISPFYARAAMVDLGNGLDTSLHVKLINAYLPETKHIPINGEASPSLYGRGTFASAKLEAEILAAKVKRRLVKKSDLADSRGNAMIEVMKSIPKGFLYEEGEGWANLGAQRFLQMYREASHGISQKR